MDHASTHTHTHTHTHTENGVPNRLAAVVFQVLVFTQAMLLVTAAALKAWLVATDPFADLRTGYPTSMLVLAIVIELVVAGYLLLGRDRTIKWRLLAGLFSLFGILSVVRWCLGISGCGCLGAIEIPGWILPLNTTLVLLVLATLAAFPPSRQLFDFRKTGSFPIRHLLDNPSMAGGLTGGMLIVVLVCAYPWLGHIPLVSMIADQPPMPSVRYVAGDLPFGQLATISIPWRNITDRTIEFLGSQTSCTCIGLAEPRIVAEPRQQIDLTVQIRPREPGRFHQRIVCFVDHPQQDRLTLDVVGIASQR